MLRKILCATDLTPGSELALEMALDLGHRYQAEVNLVHVIESAHVSKAHSHVGHGHERDLMYQVVQAEERASLTAMMDMVARRDQATRTRLWVRHGAPADTVVNTAIELEADLLVVGTHARTGIARALLGSVAERISRSAPCPVLLARPPIAR